MIFRSATAVRPLLPPDAAGAGRYEAEICPGWDIRGNANGGYMMAIAGRAMQEASGRRDVATLTAHFLAPGAPGPVQVDTHVVKAGKRFSTVTGSMSRDGKPVLQLVGAFTEHAMSGDSLERVEGTPPDLPPIEDCTPVVGTSDGFPPEIMNRVSIHMHPDDAFWSAGPSGNLKIRGWLNLLDDEPVDSLTLLLAADVFPPTIFAGAVPAAWVPTVEMTCHIRRTPVPGPLRCEFTTRFVSGGFLEEDGEVWDSSGLMVAQSRQLALLPRSEQAQ